MYCLLLWDGLANSGQLPQGAFGIALTIHHGHHGTSHDDIHIVGSSWGHTGAENTSQLIAILHCCAPVLVRSLQLAVALERTKILGDDYAADDGYGTNAHKPIETLSHSVESASTQSSRYNCDQQLEGCYNPPGATRQRLKPPLRIRTASSHLDPSTRQADEAI